MRKFHILKINEYHEEKNKKIEEQKTKSNPSSDKSIKGPNINPSSTYNFNK